MPYGIKVRTPQKLKRHTLAVRHPAWQDTVEVRRQRRRRWTHLASRFLSASEATTAVEVGLLGLPFLSLIVGIVVIGFMAWSSSTLDFATQKAARQIMTGALQANGTTAPQFRSGVLCAYLPSPLFDCSKLVVNLTTIAESNEPTGWYDLVTANQSGLIRPVMDNAVTSFCLGAGNSYQVLQVLYPFPIYFRLVATPAALAANQFVVMSTLVFKNEPFQSSSSGTC